MALDTAPAAPKNKGKGKVSHDQLDDFGLPVPQAGGAPTAETLPWCVLTVRRRGRPADTDGKCSWRPRRPGVARARVEKYRPATLDDLISQKDIVATSTRRGRSTLNVPAGSR